MSQLQPSYLPLGHNEKQLELLRKVLEKTRQNKIRWMKMANGYIGLAPPVRFTFQAASGSWQSFAAVVGTKEILKVENGSVPGLIGQLVGLAPDPVLEITNQIYQLVARGEASDVEAAINALDNL